MRRDSISVGLAFIAPSLIGFSVFLLLPVFAGLVMSLFEWDLFHSPRFVGLRNFRDLLGWTFVDGQRQANDPRFWKFVGNTLFFMLGIPVSVALSLLLAIVLNQKLRGRIIFRTVLFLPTVCYGVGLLLLWKFLYNPTFGPINLVLASLGIKGPAWLDSYHWAKPAIMTMGVWVAMGGTNMIIYLAGLQNIPPELFEAAQIDGADRWQRFQHVTLPLLRPTTFFIFTTSIIASLQGEFDAAYVMTRGGPEGATTTTSYYIYKHAFEWFNMGYASAIAVILFAMILVATFVNWRFFSSKARHG